MLSYTRDARVWVKVDEMLRDSKTVHRLGRIGAEFLLSHHEKASQ